MEQTSDLNTGNEIQETCLFLPDSLTQASFWEYNLIYLYFDYPWLIYFFFFTFFAKHKVEIYKSLFKRAIIAYHRHSEIFYPWKKKGKKSPGINILNCCWYPWMTKTSFFLFTLKTWHIIRIVVLKYLTWLAYAL